MSTSAEKTWLKKALTQLYITIFTAVFGAIYEHFSFGVYSYYMLYAFAIPLLLGVLPYTLAAFRGGRTPRLRGTRYWTAGIITLGAELGVDYRLTTSCYDPDPAGRSCGHCDSCRLRHAGFVEAGIPDPTRYVDPLEK